MVAGRGGLSSIEYSLLKDRYYLHNPIAPSNYHGDNVTRMPSFRQDPRINLTWKSTVRISGKGYRY